MERSIKKIILCDTINHATPILLEWSYGLQDLGYEIGYLPIPQHSILEIGEEVDMLIYAGIQGYHLDEFTQFKHKYPNTKIIGANSEWNSDYVNFKDIVDFFVGAIDFHPTVKQQYNLHGFKWYNIALAANHRLFNKIKISKIYDMCFIGNLSHGYRGEDKFLYPILNNEKYNCFLGGITYGKYNYGFIPYQEHNQIRNQTKININFHVPYQKPGQGEWPGRVDCNQSVFNIALSGNFQLCDHPLAQEYFKGNVVVADETNWLELFEYYLNHPEEREEKAYNAMLLAQEEHTWLARMKQFIKIVNEHYEK
jgi:spore maturation protein CgeB